MHSESVRAPRAARSTTRDCSHTSLCCSRLSNAQCSRKKVEFRPHIPCACLSSYFVDGYVDSTFFVFSSEGLSASCLRSWDEGHRDGDWAYAVGYGGYRYPCRRRTGTLHIAGADTICYFCLLSSLPFSPIYFYLSFCIRSVCWFRATCVSSSTIHFPGQCWARILHESSNAAVLAESSRSSKPEAWKSSLSHSRLYLHRNNPAVIS